MTAYFYCSMFLEVLASPGSNSVSNGKQLIITLFLSKISLFTGHVVKHYYGI